MGLNKTVWTVLTANVVNASSESALSLSGSIDLESTVQLAISIENFYATNASYSARLNLYASSDNTSDWDTNAFGYFDNELGANTTKQITVPICPDPRYLKISVTNQDSKNISAIKVVATQGTY